MPISYQEIRTDRQWKASTGLSENEFYKLANLFAIAYEEFHEITLAEEIEKRLDSPKFKSYEDILFFLLSFALSNFLILL